jgi:hypothetical protein
MTQKVLEVEAAVAPAEEDVEGTGEAGEAGKQAATARASTSTKNYLSLSFPLFFFVLTLFFVVFLSFSFEM